METMPADHYYAVWRIDGEVQARSGNAPPDLVRPAMAAESAHAARTRGSVREFYRYTNAGRCFLVGRSIAPEIAGLHRLAWYFVAAGSGVLAIGLIGGWWLASRAIRPIDQISATAERIAAGDLTQRVPAGDGGTELGRLAGVLNSMFSRLEAAFAQQARFTADAAHELRTPVTVILTHSQNGLAAPDLGDEPREGFEACQRAAQRMRHLIESLLELARLDAGQERIKHEPVDLADVARDVIELVSPLAEARGITIHTELARAPTCGDVVRLAQVVTNLVTNAIEHNFERGEVRVATCATDTGSEVIVADNGPGIAQTHLPHVFDRFYRADAARSSAAAHTGLGLAIAKVIVEAHGGTLEAASANGGGAIFTMRLSARSSTG
jgi:heavy metal sensor kinase